MGRSVLCHYQPSVAHWRYDRPPKVARRSRQHDHRSRCPLTDYYALLAYAAANLDRNTAAFRRALYERARTSLVTQMRKLDPALSESEIRREQFALEEAIRKLEAEKLSRLAQRDDHLSDRLNELVQNMEQVRQQIPLRRKAW